MMKMVNWTCRITYAFGIVLLIDSLLKIALTPPAYRTGSTWEPWVSIIAIFVGSLGWK
jgi:energy-converting hydrogenase Eha subunit C